MRQILTTIFILALLGFGAYYLFTTKQNGHEEFCIQVITTARNPVTGEVREFPTPCDVPRAWEVIETDEEFFFRGDESWTRFKDDNLGLRFEYRVDPDPYLLVERDETAVPHDELLEYLSLFNKADYEEVIASKEPREGPPPISFRVYDNPDELSPLEWANANDIVSNIEIVEGEVEETEFSGMPAIRYTTDALYTSDIIIAAHAGKIYYISGSYGAEGAPIREDFLEMLDYIRLY